VSVEKLSGTYTYRSFLDRPEPVDDFDRLRFAQLELRVSVDTGGALSGELVFPASAGTAPLAMDVGGTVAGSPLTQIRYTGKGRPDTAIADSTITTPGSRTAGYQ
jgi:hypothetical protein